MSIHVENKPQFYVSCGHLEVERGEGEGEGLVPPEEWMVKFPGAYREDGEFSGAAQCERVGVGADGGVDPSIDINIYADDMVGVTVSFVLEWGSGLGMRLTVGAGLHHSWGTDLAWVSSLLQEPLILKDVLLT